MFAPAAGCFVSRDRRLRRDCRLLEVRRGHEYDGKKRLVILHQRAHDPVRRISEHQPQLSFRIFDRLGPVALFGAIVVSGSIPVVTAWRGRSSVRVPRWSPPPFDPSRRGAVSRRCRAPHVVSSSRKIGEAPIDAVGRHPARIAGQPSTKRSRGHVQAWCNVARRRYADRRRLLGTSETT
jgi:hypothetical protein